MVIGVFPIAKLGTLLLGQMSKPLANSVKKRAKNNHYFRNYICMPPAQCYNWCEVKVSRLGSGVGASVKIPKLNDEKAIELGANLLGEIIVFGIAAAVLFREFGRTARKEEEKEEDRLNKVATLQITLQELNFQAERKDAQLRELMRKIAALQGEVVTKPWVKHPSHAQTDKPPDHSTPAPFTPFRSTLPGGATPHADETAPVPLRPDQLQPSPHTPPPPSTSSPSETSPVTPALGSLPPSEDIAKVVEGMYVPKSLNPLDKTTFHTDKTLHGSPTLDPLPPPIEDIGKVVKGIYTPESLILPDETTHETISVDPPPPSEDMNQVLAGIETLEPPAPPVDPTSPTDETAHGRTTVDSVPPRKDIGPDT